MVLEEGRKKFFLPELPPVIFSPEASPIKWFPFLMELPMALGCLFFHERRIFDLSPCSSGRFLDGGFGTGTFSPLNSLQYIGHLR